VTRCLALALAGACAAAFAATAEPTTSPLRFNPFLAPPLSDLAAGGATGSSAAWQPVLRATLQAGEESLADLGGVVLAIGEETGGYRLLEVREFAAVFDHNGEHIELEVPTSASLEP